MRNSAQEKRLQPIRHASHCGYFSATIANLSSPAGKAFSLLEPLRTFPAHRRWIFGFNTRRFWRASMLRDGNSLERDRIPKLRW